MAAALFGVDRLALDLFAPLADGFVRGTAYFVFHLAQGFFKLSALGLGQSSTLFSLFARRACPAFTPAEFHP